MGNWVLSSRPCPRIDTTLYPHQGGDWRSISLELEEIDIPIYIVLRKKCYKILQDPIA